MLSAARWDHQALPAWRMQKAQSLHFEADRRLSVAVWLLLKRLLAERGFDADSLPVRIDASGKPAFTGDAAPHFSLSHSDEMVMAAISSSPVGCDIERIPRLQPGLAEECLSSEELASLPAARWGHRALPVTRAHAFCRLWTRKESYLKALGCGLSANLREITVLSPTLPPNWRIEDCAAPAGYCAAVCRQAAVTPR